MKKKNFKKEKFEVKKFGNSRNLGKPTNDARWYYPDPSLQKLAAAVSMNDKVGTKVRLADNVNLKESSHALNVMPGVYVNPIMHVPGIANSPTDPLNDATRANMNRIREQINATRSYEMPDLGKYFLAIADLFSWVEFLKLVYKLCNKFNPLNRYTPTALLRALHIDTTDVNNLRIQLAFYINTVVYKLSNLKVPTDIPIVPTWIEDYKHVFVDEDIAKAQYIMNAPMYVLKYTIDSETSKSKLITKDFWRTHTYDDPANVNDLMTFTEDLMSELLNDEDFAIITGDVMKSYSSFYQLEPIDVNAIVEFEYSKEYLEKWHNSCQCSAYQASSVTISGWEVVEDTSTYMDPYLKFNPIFTCNNTTDFVAETRGAGNRIMDFYDREVTPDQIINAALWMFSYEILSVSDKEYHFKTTGTSLVGNGEITYYTSDGDLQNRPFYGSLNVTYGTGGIFSAYEDSCSGVIQLSKWNYKPITILVLANNSAQTADVGLLGLIGDFGNYTIIDQRILENIDTCILYGQYNVQHFLQG